MKYRNLVGYVLAGLIIIGLSPIILDIKKNQRSNALAVTKITPKEGPTAGGNTIVIEGSDFKKRVTVKQISVGGGVTCLLSSEQKVYCWGDNFYGAVGNGEGGTGGLNPGAQEYITAPQAVVQGEIPNGVKIKQISSGTYVVYAIGTDDQIYFWGAKHFSPVKLSSYDINLPSGVKPIKIQASHYGFADTSEAVVLGSDNKVYVLDKNQHTALPIPNGQISSAEKIVDVAISKDANQGSKGVGAICALTDLGKAYCSPYNAPFTAIPQGQIPIDAKITSISVASSCYGHTPEILNDICVLTTDGQAYCWGTVGVDGVSSYHTTPALVKMPQNKKVKKIKTGQVHICLISDDDQAYCWSNDNENYEGIGVDITNASSYQPNPILAGQIPAGVKIVDIDLNSSDRAFETCAIGDNKKAYCWGSNFLGQPQLDGKPFIFDSEISKPVNNPTLVPFGTDDETKVTIDGIPVTARIINQQRLEFTAPPHAPGKVDVVVMNKTDVVTLVKGYAYVDNVNPQPSQPQPQPAEPNNNPVNDKTLTPNSGYQKRNHRIRLGVLVSGLTLVVIGLVVSFKRFLKIKK